MRVFLSNLGCKLNQAELEGLARRFAAAGHEIAPSLAKADLHVVNTCTVTHAAARDSRKVARRGRRANPKLKTVLTGCWVESDPAEAAALAEVDLVVPNADKERLVERVAAAFGVPGPLGVEAGPVPVPYVPLTFGNARAAVKVEDGCNMSCAFCVIPATRGRQRSRPLEEVAGEVAALAAGGFAEVVVTGVQISAYRDGGRGLYELVATLMARTPVERLRLTSIAPWQLDRRLLELFAGGRLCRHLHLSLQSGCDATLRRMRRPYTAAAFASLLAETRRAVPGLAVTTDVIVGFPGETTSEFEDSLAFVREMGFARVHAFPYSRRPGTEAATMLGQVDPAERKARMARMLEAATRARRTFWGRRVGEAAAVLWERWHRGWWRGTSDHYVPVAAEGPASLALAHRITRCRLLAVADDGVRGEPLDGSSTHRCRPAVGGAARRGTGREAARLRPRGGAAA